MTHIKTLTLTLLLAASFALPLHSYAEQTPGELLASLLERLYSLQAQLAELRGEAPPVSCPTFYRNLYRGVEGTDVAALQRYLTKTGDYTYGEITSYYGPATEAAVQRFQCREMNICSGTPESNGYGVVGPMTQGAVANQCSVMNQASNTATTPEADNDDTSTSGSGSSGSNTYRPKPDDEFDDPIGFGARLDFTTSVQGDTVTINIEPIEIGYCGTGTNPPGTITWGDGESTDVNEGGPSTFFTADCDGGDLKVSHTYDTSGTYTITVTYAGYTKSRSVVVVIEEETEPVNPSQTVMINKNNVYSPFMLDVDGDLKMYFGGWESSGQINDNIYVADCNSNGTSCSNIRSVIDPLDSGLVHVNDPTIIRHPGGYFIMYMTVLRTGGYDEVEDTHIYYATSWDDDGINWSEPKLLMEGYWLPSAVINGDGEIELFAYAAPGSRNKFLSKFNMGESGIVPQFIGEVGILNRDNTALAPQANAHVIYNDDLGFYQILGESMPSNGKSEIDYLTSVDGLSWGVQIPGVIKPASGQYRVGTPATHPDNIFRVYFGSTERNDSLYMNIRRADWKL